MSLSVKFLIVLCSFRFSGFRTIFGENVESSSLSSTTGNTTGGLKFRVTDKGIRYALDLAEKIVNEKMKTTKLPGIRVQIDAGPGQGQVEVRKLYISDFNAPTYQYQPLPPTGLQWSAQDGSITLKGAWSAWYNFLFKVSVKGYFIATINNLTMSAVLDITKSEDGRPQIKVPNCRAAIGSVRVKVTGGAVPNLINLFRGAIEDGLEEMIPKRLCDLIQKTLIERANNKIQSLPAKIKIREILGHQLTLDYTLTSDPVVTDQYFEADVNGALTFEGDRCETPDPRMVISNDNDRMMYIFLSDYIPQSFLDSAQKSNILKRTVDKEKMPHLEKLLSTSCTSDCLGLLLENIGQKYPNTFLILEAYTNQAPTIKFGNPTSELFADIYIDVYLEPEDNRTFVLTLQMALTASIKPSIRNNKLYAGVIIESTALTVHNSTVGEIPAFNLFLMSMGVPTKIQERVDGLTKNGFPIPTYDNIEFVNSKIVVLDRAFKIETDFEYVNDAGDSTDLD